MNINYSEVDLNNSITISPIAASNKLIRLLLVHRTRQPWHLSKLQLIYVCRKSRNVKMK